MVSNPAPLMPGLCSHRLDEPDSRNRIGPEEAAAGRLAVGADDHQVQVRPVQAAPGEPASHAGAVPDGERMRSGLSARLQSR